MDEHLIDNVVMTKAIFDDLHRDALRYRWLRLRCTGIDENGPDERSARHIDVLVDDGRVTEKNNG